MLRVDLDVLRARDVDPPPQLSVRSLKRALRLAGLLSVAPRVIQQRGARPTHTASLHLLRIRIVIS